MSVSYYWCRPGLAHGAFTNLCILRGKLHLFMNAFFSVFVLAFCPQTLNGLGNHHFYRGLRTTQKKAKCPHTSKGNEQLKEPPASLINIMPTAGTERCANKTKYIPPIRIQMNEGTHARK